MVADPSPLPVIVKLTLLVSEPLEDTVAMDELDELPDMDGTEEISVGENDTDTFLVSPIAMEIESGGSNDVAVLTFVTVLDAFSPVAELVAVMVYVKS